MTQPAGVYVDPPTSLATRYLYQGAMLLPKWQKESPVTDQILRGLWACGVTVVAPVGVVYHAAQAARYALESCCNEKASELAEKHFTCAGDDLARFLFNTTYVGPTSVAALAAGAIFGGLIWAAVAVAVWHVFVIILLISDDDPLSVPILWFQFAEDPCGKDSIVNYDFSIDEQGAKVARQASRYQAFYDYECLVLQKIAKDEALTEDDIYKLTQRGNRCSRDRLEALMPHKLVEEANRGRA